MKPGDLVKVIRSSSQWIEATHAVARKINETRPEWVEIGTVALLVLEHPDDHFLHDHVRILVGETLYEISAKNVKVVEL